MLIAELPEGQQRGSARGVRVCVEMEGRRRGAQETKREQARAGRVVQLQRLQVSGIADERRIG